MSKGTSTEEHPNVRSARRVVSSHVEYYVLGWSIVMEMCGLPINHLLIGLHELESRVFVRIFFFETTSIKDA